MGNNVARMEEETVAEPEVVVVAEEVTEQVEPSTEEAGEVEVPAASEEVAEEAPAEEEPEEEEKKVISVDDIKTAPMDFRFPTTNQAKHCFTRYNEYHKCIAEKGDENKCQKYAKYYRAICPGEWVDRWNEQREAGAYVGRY
eukprot:jgi/Mesen1/5336/ME000267S04489